MIDWGQLEELYRASKSDNERVRNTALSVIEANIDAWIEEFLSLPENLWDYDALPGIRKGRPKYQTFEELARWVTNWLDQKPGESNEDMHTRKDRLKSDRLGILVRAHRLADARARRTCDCDCSTIFGDRFYLSVHWCAGQPPHTPKEI